jgi:site-specific DNA-methyltransferase (adenine-specific)
MVAQMLSSAGFADVQADQRQGGGVSVSLTARDERGSLWLFDVCGGCTTYRAGLQRSDALWKALGKAAVLRQVSDAPLVLVTAGLPTAGSAGAGALQQVCGAGKPVHAVIDLLNPAALDQLGALYEV